MIKQGNISKNSEKYKNWFLGPFIVEEDFNTKNSRNFEAKWSKREAGYFHLLKENIVNDESCSSMAICVYGEFQYSFLEDDGTYKDYPLVKEGDFVFWTPDINHKVKVIKDSLFITIRWYK